MSTSTDTPTGPAISRRPRRPRYAGRNPRRFEEKYKELDPEKYPEAVAKVAASGKTPAGTHRPVCVAEVLEVLAPKPGDLAVDATLGYGGHATEILQRILPGGRLLALDVDALELSRTEARLQASGLPAEALTVRHSNYAGLARLLPVFAPDGVDLILADLGCSSMQLDDPSRGFSFKHDGPLDLRMNPRKEPSAAALLATLDEARLARLLAENADEPQAALIARAVVAARSAIPLVTTGALATVVRAALSSGPESLDRAALDRTLARVFQALRIAVNDEFSALETFLRHLPSCLKPGGRVAILTFHSGEDRRVKKAFQAGERDGIYVVDVREVIRPTPEEIRANPRAACAKLRWAMRTTG